MELYRKTKWLRFSIVNRKPKTLVLHVHNKNDQFLGEIAWFGSWRQYVFMSEDGIIYNNGCLTDIAEVLTDLNKEHRKGNQKNATTP